jgi:hypothetical protein
MKSYLSKSFHRYVDDSHARFQKLECAERFQKILNAQNPKIQYTMDKEDENKVLEFLDIKIINNGTGKYEFDIFRKQAITNVQVKPQSSHDPRILRGIFKGFVHRAISICSENYIDKELDFLVTVFVENGYQQHDLLKIVEEVKFKLNQPRITVTNNNIANEPTTPTNLTQTQTISLPWIPGVSPKLRKIYRKAGYKVVFKSNRNLQMLLTAKNKTILPKNSYPGVYKIPCSCGITPYRGETKIKISSRNVQHEECMKKEKWDNSAVALHSRNCQGEINFENTETVKVIYNKFDRKVREALEIQLNECGPKKGGMNLDEGQYVSTKFWIPFFDHLRKK